MSWSVLSAGLALAGSSVDGVQLNAIERGAWSRLEPSVAYVLRGGRPVGLAALIDSRGLYLAHRSAVSGGQVKALLADGREIEFDVRASDAVTQMTLLKASEWPQDARPLQPLLGTPLPGAKLLAALPSGPIRAEYSAGKRVGMLAGDRRLLPLSEIRFAAPESLVGGCLVLTLDGQIVGFLNATLGGDDDTADAKQRTARQAPSNDMSAKAGSMMELAAPAPKFGPADMTVAYAIGPSLMKRVIEGFRSGSAHVPHPSIGVMAKDAPNGDGALLQTVEPGGAADRAGLKVGDIVYEIAGKRIRNQLDLALVVLEQEVGADLTARVRRAQSRLSLRIRMGSQKNPRAGNPESPTGA